MSVTCRLFIIACIVMVNGRSSVAQDIVHADGTLGYPLIESDLWAASHAVAPLEPLPTELEVCSFQLSLPFRSGGRTTSPSRLAQLPLGNPSFVTRLNNNFNGDPEFSSGVRIVGRNIAMKIGGFVKADFIKDFDAIDSTDSFDTTTIPTNAPDRENARFHARQSRLSFDTRWMVAGHVTRAFIEADFFGEGANGSDALRMRHAYGTIGRYTAGKTWTTFTDPSAVPDTLDFEGAVSNVNRRQGQVRWTQQVWRDGLSFSAAIEDPQVTAILPPLFQGEVRSETPDVVSRLRYELDWGEFQVANVLRRLGVQPDNGPVLTKSAWGFNFTGSFLWTAETKSYFQITFGEGIGSYRGTPDIIPTGPASAAILPMFGWMVGTKHEWSDCLTSNFTFSKLSLGDVAGQDVNNPSDTTYFSVNLIANPYKRVFIGAEYLYGVLEEVSGEKGTANRLQTSFGFYLP